MVPEGKSVMQHGEAVAPSSAPSSLAMCMKSINQQISLGLTFLIC